MVGEDAAARKAPVINMVCRAGRAAPAPRPRAKRNGADLPVFGVVRAAFQIAGERIRARGRLLRRETARLFPTDNTPRVRGRYIRPSTWGLYSAYTWTTDGRDWRAGLTSAAVITALFALGVWAFHAMYAAFGVPLG